MNHSTSTVFLGYENLGVECNIILLCCLCPENSFSWYGSWTILDLCKLGWSQKNDFTCIIFLVYKNLGVDT